MKEIPGKLGWAYVACFLKPLRKGAQESEVWGGKQDQTISSKTAILPLVSECFLLEIQFIR